MKFDKVKERLDHLEQLLKIDFATATAKDMWITKLNYQKRFFKKLQLQLNQSQYI